MCNTTCGAVLFFGKIFWFVEEKDLSYESESRLIEARGYVCLPVDKASGDRNSRLAVCRVAPGTPCASVIFKLQKQNVTWYPVLASLKTPNQIQRWEYSNRGDVDGTGYISSWKNPNGNVNFPYMNESGNVNFNWADNDLNENWRLLFRVSKYVRSPLCGV